MLNRHLLLISITAAMAVVACGCSTNKTRIGPPSLSASGVASRAMKQYDTDGDGVISGAELEKAPGLNAALANLDKDGDGGISDSEIRDRVDSWTSSQLGLASVRCRVRLDGRALTDATVTFEPEDCLADTIKAGSDVTDNEGVASPTIPEQDRPNPLFSGLTVGLYKVKISKMSGGKETVPAKYNTETVLGQEIAPDGAGMSGNYLDFDLESK